MCGGAGDRVAALQLQSPWFNAELGVLCVRVEFFMFSPCVRGFPPVLQLLPTSQKHASRLNGCAKLPLVVKECVRVCIVPCDSFRACFCLMPIVPGIGSSSTTILTRIKQLLKMNEVMNELYLLKPNVKKGVCY